MKQFYYILTLFLALLAQPILQAQNDTYYPRGIPKGTDEKYENIPEKAPLTRSFFIFPLTWNRHSPSGGRPE